MAVIGSDEVGRGAICGDVYVCAFKCPDDFTMSGLNDSKKLSKKKREYFDKKLRELTDCRFAIAMRSNDEIDARGISKCLNECYEEAILKLYKPDDIVILDGNVNFLKNVKEINQNNIKLEIKADGKFLSVMAASILAKVARDTRMTELGKEYPQYNWHKNSGYGSPDHKEAIRKFGFTKLHRKSYNIKL